MTISRQQMADLQERIFDQLRLVRVDGQKEYAHDEDNAMANFERVGAKLGIPREKVLMVYFEKHLDGIHAHLNGHTSQREPVVGRIKDSIMYLMLLWGMVEDAKAIDAPQPRTCAATRPWPGGAKSGYVDCLTCIRVDDHVVHEDPKFGTWE